MASSRSFEFGHAIDAPRRARRFAAQRLVDAGHEDLRPAVELLVSELVTNVIRHTDNGGVLCIDLREDGLRIEVTDDAVYTDLHPSRPDDSHASGRGLFILDAAASRWGVRYPDSHHKCVWFEVPYGAVDANF